jgi:TrpR-related protein YerC/YecD
MKRRNLEPRLSRKAAETGLCKALLALDSVEQMRAFMRDLCTPAELEALTDRWSVVPLVLEGRTYRDIHERTAVSITTIGRVARCISDGNGGYLAAAEAASRGRGGDAAGKRARA